MVKRYAFGAAAIVALFFWSWISIFIADGVLGRVWGPLYDSAAEMAADAAVFTVVVLAVAVYVVRRSAVAEKFSLWPGMPMTRRVGRAVSAMLVIAALSYVALQSGDPVVKAGYSLLSAMLWLGTGTAAVYSAERLIPWVVRHR